MRLHYLTLFLAVAAVSPSMSLAQRSGAAGTSTTTAVAPPLSPAQRRANLLDPSRAFWKARAPDTVHAAVETSRGTFTIEVVRDWAPAGADRFYNLARSGYFDDSRFFRVIWGFVAQFGIAGDPVLARIWGSEKIRADSVRQQNVRGNVTFAQASPSTRTSNIFVNLRDNPNLDTLGFAPIGRVIEGMFVLDSLYSGYGEVPAAAPPMGNPTRLYGEGNRYLDKEFPLLDKIIRITLLPRPTGLR